MVVYLVHIRREHLACTGHALPMHLVPSGGRDLLRSQDHRFSLDPSRLLGEHFGRRETQVMRCFATYFLLLLAFASFVFADDLVTTEALDALFDHDDYVKSTWSCYVSDMKTGETIYELNPDKRMVPASNQKLYVAAAALLGLGPDYRSSTRFFARGPLENGILRGDIVVRGYGAIALTSRYPRSQTASAKNAVLNEQLDELAAKLKASGIVNVLGGLAADNREWTDMLTNEHYPSATALMFNENTLDIHVEDKILRHCPDRLGVFRLNPTVLAGGRQHRLDEGGKPSDTIQVGLAEDNDDYWRLASPIGSSYYLDHLMAVLETRGIFVAGNLLPLARKHQEMPLFQLDGLSLGELVSTMLSHSDNLRSEVVFLNLGYERRGRATYKNAAKACKDLLETHGMKLKRYRPVDGSGLSPRNRVSTRETVELLRTMSLKPHFELFKDALPVAGESGTLARRLSAEGIKGRVRAKTGTIDGVKALSGYAESAGGRQIMFSIICNDSPGSDRCWKTLESVLVLLVGSGRE